MLRALAPVAVWAHGSLAGGDYQEGRSDLDLIAVLEGPVPLGTVRQVARLHRRLRADEPLAEKLHCSYLTPDTMAGAERSHLTWAHDQLMKRPVTPVTRRELHAFGLVLHGKPPEGLLPPTSDRELDAFVVRDQKEFWRPAVRKARLWRAGRLGRPGDGHLRPGERTLRDGPADLQAGGPGHCSPDWARPPTWSRTSGGGDTRTRAAPRGVDGAPGRADAGLPRPRDRRPRGHVRTAHARVSVDSVAGPGTGPPRPPAVRAATAGRAATPIHTRQEPNMWRPTRTSGRSVKYWT